MATNCEAVVLYQHGSCSANQKPALEATFCILANLLGKYSKSMIYQALMFY